MSQLAKAGVAAGVSQLRETDIGALAQLVRMLNIASGAGLMACAGLMTLWECTMDLWLCNPDDENSRCVDLGIELCGDDDGDDDAAAGAAGSGGGGGGGSGGQALAEGVQYAHVSSSQAKPSVKKEDQVAEAGGEVDLSDLMAQLKGVQG